MRVEVCRIPPVRYTAAVCRYARGRDDIGVGHFVAFVDADSRCLELPVVVEPVFQVDIHGKLFRHAAVPVRAGIGRAGQADFTTIAVARQAGYHGSEARFAVADTYPKGGVI